MIKISIILVRLVIIFIWEASFLELFFRFQNIYRLIKLLNKVISLSKTLSQHFIDFFTNWKSFIKFLINKKFWIEFLSSTNEYLNDVFKNEVIKFRSWRSQDIYLAIVFYVMGVLINKNLGSYINYT